MNGEYMRLWARQTELLTKSWWQSTLDKPLEILGVVASLLAVIIYQGNYAMNHKPYNIVLA